MTDSYERQIKEICDACPDKKKCPVICYVAILDKNGRRKLFNAKTKEPKKD